MLKTSSWSMGRTQFRKKILTKDHLLRLPLWEKKHPKEKRRVQLLHVPQKNISKTPVDYHHFKAQKVMMLKNPPKKRGLSSQTPQLHVPRSQRGPPFWEISFCKPYITWLFYGFIIPKNCCREHQLNTMGKTRTLGVYTPILFPWQSLLFPFPQSHLQLQWNASYWTSGHSWQLLLRRIFPPFGPTWTIESWLVDRDPYRIARK